MQTAAGNGPETRTIVEEHGRKKQILRQQYLSRRLDRRFKQQVQVFTRTTTVIIFHSNPFANVFVPANLRRITRERIHQLCKRPFDIFFDGVRLIPSKMLSIPWHFGMEVGSLDRSAFWPRPTQRQMALPLRQKLCRLFRFLSRHNHNELWCHHMGILPIDVS